MCYIGARCRWRSGKYIYKMRQLKPDMNMKVYASFDNGERICVNRSYKKSFNEYLNRMRRLARILPLIYDTVYLSCGTLLLQAVL